ncbi:MAG TPA: FGGY-family carbohydrate kinase, partial [Thermomicrobiales bacterium]|nr:FGGY-family carbohydrate kinase [Thermomicrobiales bacterium]
SGITRGTTAAHIARATLEAIAFQGRDVLDAMQSDAGIELGELHVDGGASQNDLLMQIQADILGVPVVRPKVVETTVRGAAFLAGLATGIWNDREELRARLAIDRRFEPAIPASERDERYAIWQERVGRTRT